MLQNLTALGHGAETFIIMSVESAVGVACGCLPGCKPLVNKLFPRYFGMSNNSSNQYPRRWRHNHAKQIDDEGFTQESELVRAESTQSNNPKAIHQTIITQPTALHYSISRQTQRSVVPSLISQSSTLSRSTSHATTHTINTKAPQSPSLHRSLSHHAQTSFTTTITAQPHLSHSASRHTSRWKSVDIDKPLPIRPPPPAVSPRPSTSRFRKSDRGALRDLSETGNASTELFVLQGRDHGADGRSAVQRNDVWMG